MEAGTGIEPVFTDLQSNPVSFENKPVTAKKYQDKAGTPGERDTPAQKPKSILSQYMQDRHKRMSRMLGYTLTMGAPEAWGSFSTVCRARLTVCERAGMAIAALRSLPDEYALDTAATAIGSMGDPLPPFLGGMEDARWWASYATRQELKAYALACFEAMAPHDRMAFFRHISTVEVAA